MQFMYVFGQLQIKKKKNQSGLVYKIQGKDGNGMYLDHTSQYLHTLATKHAIDTIHHFNFQTQRF